MRLIENAGARIEGIMCDNYAANRKLHDVLRKTSKVSEDSYKVIPIDGRRYLYWLFDPNDLLKCTRNNWVSEEMQTIEIWRKLRTEKMRQLRMNVLLQLGKIWLTYINRKTIMM